MKKIILFSVVIFLLTTSFSSTDSDRNKRWVPVFMTRTELEQSVKYLAESRPIKNPKKIYKKGDYIYVSELYKGVHVINNTNPSSPQQEGFILVPGCVDMAIKGDILYVDNSTDLVAFNLTSHQVTQRIKNVLPEPPAPGYYYIDNRNNRSNDMVIVGWQ